jgi:hypothetical protein
MQLLKLGNRFINLDLVTEFSFDALGATVCYDQEHTTKIMLQHEVTLLQQWLEAQAIDIAKELGDTGTQLDILEWDSFTGTSSARDTLE